MIRAELSRQRGHGRIRLHRHPPGLHPLGGAEGIPHTFAESLQVVVRRYNPTLRLVLESRTPDGGVDRLRASPAPRREPGQPALDPVATEHAVRIEDDDRDHGYALPRVRMTIVAALPPHAQAHLPPEAQRSGAVGSPVQRRVRQLVSLVSDVY